MSYHTFILELEKEFLNMEEIFNKEYLKQFMCCKYDNIYLYHFRLGTWIRNNLLNDKVLINVFEFFCIYHKDDMSYIIIRLFYIYMQIKEFEIIEH